MRKKNPTGDKDKPWVATKAEENYFDVYTDYKNFSINLEYDGGHSKIFEEIIR
jgi:hypothetical protein